MATITSIETKTASNGNAYKACSLSDSRSVNVFADHPLFSEVADGFDIPDNLLYQKGKYWNLSNPARKGGGSRGGYSSKRSADIKEAQDNKERSITFFNSTNAAIALAALEKPADYKAFIRNWRDWFIEEHDRYKNHKEQYPTDDPLKDDAPEITDADIPADW